MFKVTLLSGSERLHGPDQLVIDFNGITPLVITMVCKVF